MIFLLQMILIHCQATGDENMSVYTLFVADQSKGLLDILGALFIKLDHAACQHCVTTWEELANALNQFCTAHDQSDLKVLWDERADWWPQFHFRLDLVPNKDHVSELEWKLICHKGEAARWLLGKGTCTFFVCVHVSVCELALISLCFWWVSTE